ncbi:NUDIX hydrolase domain protein [Pseudocohnilembus persalinus]|uniref:NUDIX hydrolase domain protein n=1 Tax=Pseudocohnilembus persalinus TaxID=266149 RepID=A0A0V0QYA0_PSEPJ|nr:NUDIX hydrolase domain protein [Pseudocohnilembus persalinus]|eukprot:KRX07305.1 NUDIX hydrolase domain protein [Pseudocohnilembus persalinus]
MPARYIYHNKPLITVSNFTTQKKTPQPYFCEDQNCTLPSYCTHLIGAGGVVINSQNQILLVKEKSGNRKNKWNIPMGRVDEGEQIHEAAIREVLEETGIESQRKYRKLNKSGQNIIRRNL